MGWMDRHVLGCRYFGGLSMELSLNSGDAWLLYQRNRAIRRLMHLRNRPSARESLLLLSNFYFVPPLLVPPEVIG